MITLARNVLQMLDLAFHQGRGSTAESLAWTAWSARMSQEGKIKSRGVRVSGRILPLQASGRKMISGTGPVCHLNLACASVSISSFWQLSRQALRLGERQRSSCRSAQYAPFRTQCSAPAIIAPFQ
jgi:hypothetical protein